MPGWRLSYRDELRQTRSATPGGRTTIFFRRPLVARPAESDSRSPQLLQPERCGLKVKVDLQRIQEVLEMAVSSAGKTGKRRRGHSRRGAYESAH
jgi:hypothetical protein